MIRKTIEATGFLPKLEVECGRIEAAGVDQELAIANYMLLGSAAKDLDEYEMAIKAFNRLLEMDPDNIQAKLKKEQCEDTQQMLDTSQDGDDEADDGDLDD